MLCRSHQQRFSLEISQCSAHLVNMEKPESWAELLLRRHLRFRFRCQNRYIVARCVTGPLLPCQSRTRAVSAQAFL